MPDAVVDIALTAQYGSLTPAKCVGLLLKNRAGTPAPVRAAAKSQTQIPVATPQSAMPEPATANSLGLANQLAKTAIDECRDRRLKGELKGYVESAQCSNPRIVQAFSAANYRYMDLVTLLTTRRLEIARKQDLSQLTEAQAAAELRIVMAQIGEFERARDNQRN